MPLTYHNYIKQYPGSAVNDMVVTAERLDQQYKQNVADSDMLETMISNLELRDVNASVANTALQGMKDTLRGIRDSGRWEDAGMLVKTASKNFATDKNVQGALKDKALFDGSNAYHQKLQQDGKITEDDYKAWYAINSAKNNKAVSYDPATNTYKNLWSSFNVPEYQDIAKMARDFLEGANADTLTSAGLTKGGNGYLKAGSREQISTDEAMMIATSYLAKNQKIDARLNWEESKDDFNNRSYTDENGELQYRPIGIKDFEKFGYTVDDNTGKLMIPVLNQKGEQVRNDKGELMWEDTPENEIIYQNGQINSKAMEDMYSSIRRANNIKDYITPSVKWIDYVKDKTDYYQDVLALENLKHKNSLSLKMLDMPHSVYNGEIILSNPGTHTVNGANYYNGIFGKDGKVDLRQSVLKFGDKPTLDGLFQIVNQAGQQGVDMKAAFGEVAKLREYFNSHGLTADDIGKNSTEHFKNLRNTLDPFASVAGPGQGGGYIHSKHGTDLNEAEQRYNALVNTIGEEGLKQVFNGVADFDNNQVETMGNFAYLMNNMTASDGQMMNQDNFIKGVDGKMFFGINALPTEDQLKFAGITPKDMKDLNTMFGYDVFTQVSKETGDKKNVKPGTWQVNTYVGHQPSYGSMVAVDEQFGVKTGTNYHYGQWENAVWTNANSNQLYQAGDKYRQNYGNMIINTDVGERSVNFLIDRYEQQYGKPNNSNVQVWSEIFTNLDNAISKKTK